MANTCDWILRARCDSLKEAEELARELENLPGQLVHISDPVFEKEGEKVYLDTDGECGWGLYAYGMKEKIIDLSKGGKTIEVFSDYATKFREDGSIKSDTYQEHLIAENGKSCTYSFRTKISRYGEYTI